MHPIKIGDFELQCKVLEHDTSVTGIRYKLVVTLPVRLPKRRKPDIMRQLYGKPKPSKPRKDPIGPWVLDIGNALYRQLNFKYGTNPDVDFGKGYTTFTYFFNCVDTACALGMHMEAWKYNSEKLHQDRMVSEAWCPAFQYPYL
jgi:hypothetical protein